MNNDEKNISSKEIEDYIKFDMEDIREKVNKIASNDDTIPIFLSSLVMTPFSFIFGVFQHDGTETIDFITPILYLLLYMFAPLILGTLLIFILNKIKLTNKKRKKISFELHSLSQKKEFSNIINVILKQDKKQDSEGNLIKLTEKEMAEKIKSVNILLENIRNKDVTRDNLEFFNNQDNAIQKEFRYLFKDRLTSKEKSEAVINMNNIDKLLKQTSNKDELIEETFNFANK